MNLNIFDIFMRICAGFILFKIGFFISKQYYHNKLKQLMVRVKKVNYPFGDSVKNNCKTGVICFRIATVITSIAIAGYGTYIMAILIFTPWILIAGFWAFDADWII